MTRRRWIADEVFEDKAALTGAHADHLIRVLRARLGQEFDIAAGSVVRRGRISAITEGRVDFDLGEAVAANSSARITLLLSIFKFDRMEWAIEKCTELGVSKIVPLIAQRSDAHLVSAAAKRVERWRRIALQASEQSRRSAPPEIESARKLRDAAMLRGGLKIVLAESEKQRMLRDALAGSAQDGEILLAVGPEGGWTDDELKVFQKEGWNSASLGEGILRAETAALAAAAIVASELKK